MLSGQWVMLDARQVQERCVLVGYTPSGLLPESRDDLEEALQRWVESLREVARAELMSATVRHAGVEAAAAQIIEAVRNSGRACMAMELMPGECLLAARADVLRSQGPGALIRQAHHQALLAAKQQGLPYNTEALDWYEQQHVEQLA